MLLRDLYFRKYIKMTNSLVRRAAGCCQGYFLLRIGYTMNPDGLGPVFAPLNDLFHEGAVLQRRRRRALFCDVIENVRRLAFPERAVCHNGSSYMDAVIHT